MHLPSSLVWLCLLGCAGLAAAQGQAPPARRANPANVSWVRIDNFEIARTETTIAQFRLYVLATQASTLAERSGGGIYESGWVNKPGWHWRSPYGPGYSASDDEPAAHITFSEAKAFCAWAGGRLPTDAQWTRAAYTELREGSQARAAGFEHGKAYPYPSGEQVQGQQCLGDCDDGQARSRAVKHGAALHRGYGHAKAGSTAAGVNGLFEMGGNLWEWVDDPPQASATAERRTRGGSWWYGAAQMRVDHAQFKRPETAVAYIGFRCVR